MFFFFSCLLKFAVSGQQGHSAYYQVLHMPMCHMQQQQLTQLKLGWQDVFFWRAAFHRSFWHGKFWGCFFHQDLLVLHVIKYYAVNMTCSKEKKIHLGTPLHKKHTTTLNNECLFTCDYKQPCRCLSGTAFQLKLTGQQVWGMFFKSVCIQGLGVPL